MRPAKQPIKEAMRVVTGVEGWVEGGVLFLGKEEEEGESCRVLDNGGAHPMTTSATAMMRTTGVR